MSLIKFFLLTVLAAVTLDGFSQNTNRIKLDENTVVLDSSGTKYPYVIWRKLMETGDYTFKPKTDQEGRQTGEMIISKISPGMKLKRQQSMVKPRETPYFKTGARMVNFNLKDLNNKKYKLKEMAGKVVVLNFWFINCPPCRREIPELNKLVEKYKDNQDVVFIGIALDDSQKLDEFLKETPFNYNIVADGRYDAHTYGITSYPTHVVLDRNSTIIFHTNGLAPNTVFWVDRSIQEGLKSVVSASNTQIN